MKRILALLIATSFAFSGAAVAASHAGGKMDDKKEVMAKDGMKKDGMTKDGTKKKSKKKRAMKKDAMK